MSEKPPEYVKRTVTLDEVFDKCVRGVSWFGSGGILHKKAEFDLEELYPILRRRRLGALSYV